MLCHTEYAVQKKALLENSLLELMAQHQYQDITVTDICREAGVPRRTFYHYFEGKEGILESVVEGLMRQCFLDVLFDFRLGQEQWKRNYMKIFQYWEGENRKKLDVLIQSGLESELMACTNRWLREEKIGMLTDTAIDPKFSEIMLMVGTTDFFTLLFYWSRGGYRETPEEMAGYAMLVMPYVLFQNGIHDGA